MELWEALFIRRKEIGMSYDDLQKMTQLSISTLKKIIGGHVSAPSYESVRAIAGAMGLTMDDLDRIISGEEFLEEPHPTLTTEAQQVAEAYMKLDAVSKELVRAVIEIEGRREALPEP